MLRNLLLVGAGGAAGSMLRYAIALALPRSGKGFPWATLTVNLAGCLVIGLLAGLIPRQHWMFRTGWVLLATGVCGGFTTFSAFALDNVKLFESGGSMTAVIYTVLSIALGIVLCFAGYSLTLQFP
jgi:CrcB protein